MTDTFRADAVIHTGTMVNGISNTISDTLLSRILEVAHHVRAALPVWRCQFDQYNAFQPDIPEAGEQHPALCWTEREAAVPDECRLGNVLCAFCVAYGFNSGGYRFPW